MGEFAADQMSGYGVVYRNDGRVRMGQWKGGQAEGYGAVYDTKGKLVEQGQYSSDKLVTPLTGNKGAVAPRLTKKDRHGIACRHAAAPPDIRPFRDRLTTMTR